MTKKKELKATTAHGIFSRSSNTEYSFIVVWDSPRMKVMLDRKDTGGMVGMAKKNRGYGVTWHSTEAAAVKASKKYYNDFDAKLLGIFKVDANTNNE